MGWGAFTIHTHNNETTNCTKNGISSLEIIFCSLLSLLANLNSCLCIIQDFILQILGVVCLQNLNLIFLGLLV